MNTDQTYELVELPVRGSEVLEMTQMGVTRVSAVLPFNLETVVRFGTVGDMKREILERLGVELTDVKYHLSEAQQNIGGDVAVWVYVEGDISDFLNEADYYGDEN